MNKISYFGSLVIGAGIFQGIFLAAILFGIKKGNPKANKILALLLLAFSFDIAHSVLYTDLFPTTFCHVFKIEPFQFVLAPLIYLYVRQLIFTESRFKPAEILHFIPFLLYCFIIIPVNSIPSMKLITRFLTGNTDTVTRIIWGTVLIQTTIYMALSHQKIRQHQQRIRECYSRIDGINLRWLRYLITVLLFIYVSYYLLMAMMLHAPNFNLLFPHFQKLIAIILSLAVYGIGYRGLSQPQIFSYDTPESPHEKAEFLSIQSAEIMETPGVPSIKYEHSSLEPMEAEKISETLLSYMLQKKPYLNPELTLPELAAMLGVPRNCLSQVLNEKLGVSFYDFVNGYRVNQVKEFMAAPEYRDFKMLALAFEAGFNSKASFNSVFKKNVGLTPSQYRTQLVSSSSNNDSIVEL